MTTKLQLASTYGKIGRPAQCRAVWDARGGGDPAERETRDARCTRAVYGDGLCWLHWHADLNANRLMPVRKVGT